MRRWVGGLVIVAALVVLLLSVLQRRGHEVAAPQIGVTHPPAAPGMHPVKTEIGPLRLASGVPAGRIAGRVVFERRPFVAAEVHLGMLEDEIDLPDAVVTSRADGSFDFGLRPATASVVTASADGKAPAIAAVRLGESGDQLELELGACEPKERSVGTVRDDGGGPIVGATVHSTTAAWLAVRTDRDGRFSICHPSSDRFASFEVEADGYGSVTFIGSAQGGEHDVVLSPEDRGREPSTTAHRANGAGRAHQRNGGGRRRAGRRRLHRPGIQGRATHHDGRGVEA